MKVALHIVLQLVSAIILAPQLHAQTVDTIVGFDEIPPPEEAAASILLKSFDVYYSSSAGYTPSPSAGWCSTIDNDQYMSFKTGSTGSVAFNITSFNCTSSNGFEVGIYDIHNQLVDICWDQDQSSYTIPNLVPNLVYYIRIDGIGGDNCEFNLQFTSGINPNPTPPSVYLGRDSICSSGCVTAPTGETITCNTGLYSFEASNDTTYYGELFLDNFQELELGPLSYTWSESTCEWFVDLQWTGSTHPFYLNGQTFQNPFAQLGPFEDEEVVPIVLAGSSTCVDTLFTEATFACVSSTVSLQKLGFEVRQLNSTQLQITAPSYGWNLSLVDLLGREVLSTPLQQDSNQLHVGDLLPGTYFIVVQNGKERATKKWVKR